MPKHPRKKGTLLVGTSGWSYGGWTRFYPADLPSREYLSYYSRRFSTAEVNYSFYHLPRPTTCKKWSEQTPAGFVFALKLSRFITHIKRLRGVKVALRKFLANARVLGPKLGPVLVQLPPSFKIDVKTLARFLGGAADVAEELHLEEPLRLAFEFRHPSWFDAGSEAYEAAVEVLREHGAAMVFAHSSRYPYPSEEPLTAKFVYLRYHGPKELFASRYREQGLQRWAPKINKWLKAGQNVYAYFNNDVRGYAVEDAACLRGLLR